MDSDRIVGTAKNVVGKGEQALGDLAGDSKLNADGTVDEAKGAVQAAYGQAKDTVRDYADQAQSLAADAYDQGRKYVEEGRKRVPEADRYYRDGREAVSRHVGESPIAAVLIAGAVGYLLALLVHGRR